MRTQTEFESNDEDDDKKKDKKLVFLSRSVLQKVKDKPMVTGTQIANEILEIYKQFCQIGQKVDFKNVQRRVYDALNVLSAMDIIQKDKYNIIYNQNNKYIPSDYQFDSVSDKPIQTTQEVPIFQSLTEQQVLLELDKFQKQKEAVLEKQLKLLDMIKQCLCVEKLKQRNIDYENRQTLNDQINTGGSIQDHSHNYRLHLPLLFLEIPQNSPFNTSQDKMRLDLQCNEFILRDETALLTNLGLPKNTDQDIIKVFDINVASFLKNQSLINVSRSSCQNQAQYANFENQQHGVDYTNSQIHDGVKHTPLTKLIPVSNSNFDSPTDFTSMATALQSLPIVKPFQQEQKR